MAEILHHLGCKKTVNNGINYLSTGAAFQPSTVWNSDKFSEKMPCTCITLVGWNNTWQIFGVIPPPPPKKKQTTLWIEVIVEVYIPAI